MGIFRNGYGLCGGVCRWGTSEKNNTIKKYLQKQYGNNYREYIGIAFDEIVRAKKLYCNYKLFPLIEWKMTERQCLEYCYSKGYFWEENSIKLYDILNRVSCWCCANKNRRELENIFYYLPNYYIKRIALLKKIVENNTKNSLVSNKAKEEFIKML